MTTGSENSARDKAYAVVENADKFELRDLSGRCVMACLDQHSADHYMILLNESYAKGYRQACRDQKSRQG